MPVFTYNLGNAVGQVRLRIADTDPSEFIFNDSELTEFLRATGQDVYRAAAEAYTTIATDRARLAKRITSQGYSTERQAIVDLMALAKSLRDAPTAGSVQTGTLESDDQSYLSEYRPEWRDVDTDTVIVE